MTWTDVTVLDVQQETPCDRTFVLAPDPAATRRFTFEPGQHLKLRDPTERPERDWYFSLSGAPRPDGLLRVTVRGRGEHVQRIYEAPVGTRWVAEPPAGTFHVRGAPGETLVLLAAGSGVTPFRAFLEQERARGRTTPVWLVQCARSAVELLFHDEFSAWATTWPALRYRPTLTGEDPAWEGPTGRIGADVLAPALAEPATARVYACGPQTFIDDVLGAAEALGVASERCVREGW